MDYPWYFPNSNSGSGGGTVIVEGTDYKTITIPITPDMLTAECRINDIEEDSFGWNKQAIAIVDDLETEVEVGEKLDFEPYADKQTAVFNFSWLNPFTGYINVNYWIKNN